MYTLEDILSNMLASSERPAHSEKMPVFLDILLEGVAVSRSELVQESETQREHYLSEMMCRKLQISPDLAKMYHVKDAQNSRYAFHVPQAGKYEFCRALYRSL